MSNIIDSIRLSGTVYTIAGGSGGNPTVELTQAEYDDLVSAGTVSPTTYYIITDAQPTDISLYWTSAQTQSAITKAVSGKADSSSVYTKSETSGATEIGTALSGKQDTLSAGTNITIVDNVISAEGGGGGKAVSGGTNISITTGETADTINCTLPIIKGVYGREHSVMIGYNSQQNFGYYIKKDYSASIGFTNYINGERSVCLGDSNYANGYCSVAVNSINTAATNYSFACGNFSKTSNEYEFASGRYNVSSSASTTFGDSGNTLFSVGNGTGNNARHNAFEIRQNGDIYITSGGTDILLQDNLSGLKLVKITAADYANITPDENTVYFVGDSNGYTMKLGSVNIS